MTQPRAIVLAIGLSGLCASACTGDNAPAGRTTPSASQLRARAPSPANLTVPSRTRGAGVPHAAAIKHVALSPDGSAALTSDQIGGVRLWPSLDGSTEPVPVPARGALRMSLHKRGDRYLIAFVDSANAAHVLEANGAGKVKELMSTAPDRPVTQIAILPDGYHVVTLQEDHTFHLWTTGGTELASFEARSFRPYRFRVADDGKSLVAVIQDYEDVAATSRDLSVQRFAIALAPKPALTRLSDARKVKVTTGVELAISPDGTQIAYAVTGAAAASATSSVTSSVAKKPPPPASPHTALVGQWALYVASLRDPQREPKLLKSGLALTSGPEVAFVNPQQVMLSSGTTAKAWLIDLTTGKTHGRVGPPTHFASFQIPSAFAANRRAVGLSTWLFVQDTRKGTHRYLGFTQFQPQSGDLSPNGKWVAWPSTLGHLFIESVGAGPSRVVHLQRSQQTPITRLFFIDDEHLLLANSVGGLSIIEWGTGKLLASADTSGPFRDIEYLPARRMLRVTRTNNEVWLFRITSGGSAPKFAAQRMLDEATTHAGLLAGKADAPILWVRDAKANYKTFTWKQLTSAGPTAEPTPATPAPAPANDQPAQDRVGPSLRAMEAPARPWTAHGNLTVDRFGSTYKLTTPAKRNNPTDMLVEVRGTDGTLNRAILIDTNRVSRLMPSPDASSLLVLDHSGVVSVWDQKTGKRRWSYNFMRALNDVRWSEDSKRVIAGGSSGASVLAASDGAVVYKSCGIWFESRATAPQITSFQNQPHICEL